MTNFTAEQIIKINEIFSRVVDCKGNLKVFKDFDWDACKGDIILYTKKENQKATNKRSFSGNNFSDKFETTLEKCYKETNKMFHLCKSGEIENFSNYIPNIEKLKIDSDFGLKDQFNTIVSILLYKFQELKKEDFEILYEAFCEILEICSFKLKDADNKTIIYMNIFKKLLDYFCGNFLTNKSWELSYNHDQKCIDIDDVLAEKLKECYEINKFVCKIKLFIKENYTPLKSLEIDWDKFKNNLDDINKELFDRNSGIWRQVGKIAGAFYGLTKNDLKNIIYYGAPGTGKTKFVKDCLDILDPNRARTEWVQFHSGFEYEDFIDGIKPIDIQNGNLKLDLTNGIFKEFCLKAAQNTDENFFFIVDEINRADIAAVFGETLSLLEENYRGENIKTKNFSLNNQEFFIPANIYFIGMMNDVDKSIDCFDLALRRRFAWVLMECNYEVVENATDKAYKTKCENLNNYITKEEYRLKGSKKTDGLNLGRAYEIGHSYFLKKEAMSEQQIWNRHIEPILREYIRTQFGDRDAEDKLNIAREIFVG
ncbi:McrB family protein [Campylobacter concisus]|jgi:thiamine-phosphate diphosphorylase|uniref:McrB family protein n=1 Tax=Campylobacter concisus TaxID=199 RepID=UPI000CD95394|nr:AAA family ATPase [Campylobacter concisus]